MWEKLTKQWFLTALAVCFLVGYLLADSLKPLLGMSLLRSSIVFAVMWAMGVTLHADTIRKSLQRPLPSFLAIAINIAIVPVLALPAFLILPDRLSGGLFITALVPCTLASASVWTRKAGGDDSIAMMTTVVTNLACVLVIPIGISLVLSKQIDVSATEQMQKLAIVVVAPLILAQLMRRYGAANWADRNKTRLSTAAQLGILAMVFFGAIASAAKVSEAGGGSTPGINLALLIALAGGIHLIALWIGIAAARQSGNPAESQIAVGIAGSQKTLMVGLQIAIDCGVSVVPMLIYHLSQLVLDTVIAAKWKAKMEHR